jgi:hypothetical protein
VVTGQTSANLVIVNGFLRENPQGYHRVAIPKKWLLRFVDPETFAIVTKSILPPPDFDWDDLPMWVIEDPLINEGWFLFEDEHDAIAFKLTYC